MTECVMNDHIMSIIISSFKLCSYIVSDTRVQGKKKDFYLGNIKLAFITVTSFDIHINTLLMANNCHGVPVN